MTLPASAIAAALGVSKDTVIRRATAQRWPSVRAGNRVEFTPPPAIAEAAKAFAAAPSAPADKRVRFADLTQEPARRRVLGRQAAVLFCEALIASGHAVDRAQQATCSRFAGELPALSPATLRRWRAAYARLGLDGLVDQKLGRVGARPVAAALPQHLVDRYTAASAEYGSVARAARDMMLDPELPAAVRRHLHGAHASKSYVTPSVAAAITPAPLVVDLLQGPRHARLHGRFTPGDYSHVIAGDWWTADDMTSNCYCWVEDPGPAGFRVIQPQILPILDVGSLRWLTVRLIARDGGQYSSDDIWGLIGDALDTYGLPRHGFLFEGGHWQSNRILGHRTDLSNEDRVGGLQSLGLEMRRAWDARGKAVIEGAFNQLQHTMDRVPGYAGRDQRHELPEQLKHQLARIAGGHVHPSAHLLHLSALADHVEAAMTRLNNERNDGQILRGQSPAEKWAGDFLAPGRALSAIPDAARWLYRSAMTVAQVTANGVRVCQGSGKKMIVHYYDHPELLVPRQGQRVVVYWNDHHPEADAALLDAATRKFLGMAAYVPRLKRFTASDDELAAEGRRKAAALHFARTEIRAIEPHLQRRARPMPGSTESERTGARLAQAEAAVQAATARKEGVRRAVAKIEVRRHEIEAAAPRPAAPAAAEPIGYDEIQALFSPAPVAEPAC